MTVLAFITVYVATIRYHKNPFPEREFPLFKGEQTNFNNATLSIESSIFNETTISNATTSINNNETIVGNANAHVFEEL